MLSPREIYERDPSLVENYRREHLDSSRLDEYLAHIEPLANQDDPVAYIDHLHEQDRELWFSIGSVIVNMGPDTILEQYGHEMLAWAAINATFKKDGDAMKVVLENEAGYDLDLLEKNRLYIWQNGVSSAGKHLLKNYRLNRSLMLGSLETIDLCAILAGSARQDVELSENRINDYSLSATTTQKDYERGYTQNAHEDFEPNIKYPTYLDSPYGFILNYKGRPNAIAALGITKDDELMIYQIQGVRGYEYDPNKRRREEGFIKRILNSRGLTPLDWHKVIVEATTEIALQNGLEKIGIQAGKNNYWARHVEPNETQPHLSAEAATKAYDTPARRLGFERDTGYYGNWHKAVGQRVLMLTH